MIRLANTISSSGTLSNANVYRFSSKEVHVNSGMHYYLYRFYDPNLQRWLNRDPIWGYPQIMTTVSRRVRASAQVRGEFLDALGAANLYQFVGNEPVSDTDPLGLGVNDPPPCAPYPDCLKYMPPRNPNKPPPYWYQCIACSKSQCQALVDKAYEGCSNNCFVGCVRRAIFGGPLAFAICYGDCNAGCALGWALGQALCELCLYP